MRVLIGLSFLLAAVFCAAPLSAQDNAIKVIREDGSVEVFDLPTQGTRRMPPPVERQRRAVPAEEKPAARVAPVQQNAKPELKPEAAPAPEEDITEPVKEQEAVPVPPAPAPVPDENAPSKTAPPPSAEPPPVKKPAVKKEYKESKHSVPLPARKPYRAPLRKVKALEAGPGGIITQDAAVRIALDVAPPARRFNVFADEYKGVPAYRIVFKTDQGDHEVFIDAATGKVLKK